MARVVKRFSIAPTKEGKRLLCGSILAVNIRDASIYLKKMKRAKTDEVFLKNYHKFQKSAESMKYWKRQLDKVA